MFKFLRAPTVPDKPSRLDEIKSRLQVIYRMRMHLGNAIRVQHLSNDPVYTAALHQLNVERRLLITEAEVLFGVTPPDKP